MQPTHFLTTLETRKRLHLANYIFFQEREHTFQKIFNFATERT